MTPATAVDVFLDVYARGRGQQLPAQSGHDRARGDRADEPRDRTEQDPCVPPRIGRVLAVKGDHRSCLGSDEAELEERKEVGEGQQYPGRRGEDRDGIADGRGRAERI